MISKSECPDVHGYIFHDTSGRNHGQVLKTHVIPLERNLYGHPFAGFLEGKPVRRKFCWNLDGQKCRTGNVFLFHRTARSMVLIGTRGCHQDGWKRSSNMAPIWKTLVKLVDLGEPTSFLDHEYLGCIQRECKPNEGYHYRRVLNTCSKSRISARSN